MTVSVFCDRPCELGEGPSYDPHTDTLWWFDIADRKLLERRMDGPMTIVHDLPEMASAVFRVDTQRQVLATESGLYVRDCATGALKPLCAIESDNPQTRSNDSRAHPCGAIWLGTMGKQAEKRAGAIYWYLRGELRLLFPAITIPNSISFSSDGGVAYFADSMDGRLMRVACDPATGLPVSEPVLFFDNRRDKGGLDGSVCDLDGNVWNARWGAASVDCYSPDGRRIRSISLPAKQASCPAFCGRQADKIAVTSAWEGTSDGQRARDPRSGQTFLIDAAVNGRFEPDVPL